MDKDEQIQVQIERYLDGLMTEAENAAFEQQLQVSETLREALEEERMVRDAMQRLREQELRAKLKQWRQNAPEPPTSPELVTKKRFGWRFWLALVTVGLLVFWGIKLYRVSGDKGKPGTGNQNFQQPNPSDTSNYKAVPDPTVNIKEPVRSTNAPKMTTDPLLLRLASIQKLIDSELGYIKNQPLAQRSNSPAENPDSLSAETLAAIALEKGEFDKALQYVAQLDASNSEVRNMKAHALFGAKQYAKATEEFRAVSQKNGPFKKDAQWNIVMCYFAQYPDGQEDYRQEIEQILKGNSKWLQKKAKDWQERVQRSMPAR